MKELLAAVVLGGIVFVVLAVIVTKTIAVAIVAGVVVFLLVGFVPRSLGRRRGARTRSRSR
ncbi:MAG: hypothetical protein ACR2ND_09715 [Solirubrobacteraceae bacterium]